jgi:hypothetical protein
MPSTYTPLATNTLGSNTSSVTFSGISGSYTDLILVISGRISSTSGGNVSSLRFNSDSGNNYSMTRLSGNGTSASSDRVSNTSFAGYALVANATEFSPIIYHIQNYSNTTTNKTVLGRGNWVGSSITATVSLWRNTAAITSIEMFPNSATWIAGSTFTLYGVKSA